MTASLETRPADRFLTRFTDLLTMPDVFRLLDRPVWPNHLRIEEERTDDALVVRVEIPGIDPDKDLEIEVDDGVLTLRAERREEEREENKGEVVTEFRYGSFVRTVALPHGVVADDVTAVYRDGILTLTVPMPKETEKAPTRVAVTHS
jgi:HSP20 family protein